MTMSANKYIVIIEVDHLVTWRITSKAMAAFDAMKPRIDAAWRAERAHGESLKAAYKAKRETSDAVDLICSKEWVAWASYGLPIMSQASRIGSQLNRLHTLARFATAPFKVAESDALFLSRLEDGSEIRRLDSMLACYEAEQGAKP